MITTPEATLFFPAIAEARTYKGKNARYGATLCFSDDADLTPITDAIEAALDSKFDKRPDDLKVCYGEDGKDGEIGFPHARYLRITATTRPAIAIVGEDLQGLSKRMLEDAANRFTQGSTVRARTRIYAYSSGDNRGVTAFLDSILLVEEADPHAYRVSSPEEWEDA